MNLFLHYKGKIKLVFLFYLTNRFIEITLLVVNRLGILKIRHTFHKRKYSNLTHSPDLAGFALIVIYVTQ